MKIMMLFIFLVSLTIQAEEVSKLYLQCDITEDGVNPRIPRSFQAYINYAEKNWTLVYNVAGVSTEDFSLVGNGDIYQDKRSRELQYAYFDFEDGTMLKIDLTKGKSESDNVIFMHLEKAILKNCSLM